MRQIALLRDRVLLLILFGCIAAIVLSTLTSDIVVPDLTPYFDNVTTVIQAKLALLQGQFPLRIAAVGYSDWHYPLFQFNDPTSFTLAGLMYALISPDNPYSALKLTCWCTLVLGAVYMYRLARHLFHSSPAAILASVMYLTAPYYMIVIDHLGGFAEAMALGIVPAVLFYTLQRFEHPTANATLLKTSLVWYLLATMHVVTFFYTSIFVGLFLLFVVIGQPRTAINLFDTVLAYVFGCLLALWYLGPHYVLQNSFNLDGLAPSAETFTAYRPYLANLLSPAENIMEKIRVGNGRLDGIALLRPSLGLPLLFAGIVSVYAFFARSPSPLQSNKWLAPLLLSLIIAILMVWSPFNFWHWLPKTFMAGLYSWRLLSQVMWIGALLFAWSLCWFFENTIPAKYVILTLFAIVMATSAWLAAPERHFVELNIKQLLHQPVEVNEAGNFLLNLMKNYQSVYAIDAINNKNPGTPSSAYLNPQQTLTVKQVQPHCRLLRETTICQMTVPTGVKVLELPILYYPDMLDVTLNGKPVDYSDVLYTKYILATIAPVAGENTIVIRFRGLAWANSFSNLAWGMWCLFLVFVSLKRFSKKSI